MIVEGKERRERRLTRGGISRTRLNINLCRSRMWKLKRREEAD
jgi:hypothetical protein